MVITALQPGTNCFVAADGNWIGDSIPAVVRAYPSRMAYVKALKAALPQAAPPFAGDTFKLG